MNTKGYMCKTDYENELGQASGGNTIFPSIEDAREHLKCWKDCGLVEVDVKFVRSIPHSIRER